MSQKEASLSDDNGLVAILARAGSTKTFLAWQFNLVNMAHLGF